MNSIPTDLYETHRPEFAAYQALLLKWNEKINLTAITDPKEIEELHFLDSLAVVPHLENCKTLLDIGAGAGLPGLAIKIVRPDLEVTLIDAVKKKCDFMKAVVRELKLSGVTVLHRHLESGESIGQFDAVVSRATFKLPQLIEFAQPNLKPDGILIAMKGFDVEKEAEGIGPFQEVVYLLAVSNQKRKLLIRRNHVTF